MVDPNHSLWLSASHFPALRLPMILTKTSTKTDKSSFSQKRLISLSPHLIYRTTPFYFVTYSPFCNLIGLQYALQREQLALDQTLSARARGCGYARLGSWYLTRMRELTRVTISSSIAALTTPPFVEYTASYKSI